MFTSIICFLRSCNSILCLCYQSLCVNRLAIFVEARCKHFDYSVYRTKEVIASRLHIYCFTLYTETFQPLILCTHTQHRRTASRIIHYLDSISLYTKHSGRMFEFAQCDCNLHIFFTILSDLFKQFIFY